MINLAKYVKLKAVLTTIFFSFFFLSCEKRYQCKCSILEGKFLGFGDKYDSSRTEVFYEYKAKSADEANGKCNNDHAESIPKHKGSINGYTNVEYYNDSLDVVISIGCVIK